MTPLRILHVVPTYYPAVRYGGPIRSVHGLATALARRGHDVHVYTTSVDGSSDLDVSLRRATMLDGVSVRYFRVCAPRRLYWAPTMKSQLQATIHGFDLVHLHSVYLWPTWAAARVAERAGVPYVMSPRGMLVADMIRRRSRWAKKTWIHWIERRSLARCSALHVTADLEATEVRALKLPLPEIHVIPNGVDAPAQHVALSSGPFHNLPRPYALFLGRISWKKGLDRLIAAWKQIPDLTLIVAGNDEDDYRRTLETLAVSEGVAKRIRFIGPVSDEQKWALYEHAEMFVLPSYSENFGNAVAEAMVMACPVIVTAEVGVASLVRQSGAGVVASNEPAALAAAIRALRGDAHGRARMGAQGQCAAREGLSWESVGGRMEAVYRQIAASRNSL